MKMDARVNVLDLGDAWMLINISDMFVCHTCMERLRWEWSQYINHIYLFNYWINQNMTLLRHSVDMCWRQGRATQLFLIASCDGTFGYIWDKADQLLVFYVFSCTKMVVPISNYNHWLNIYRLGKSTKIVHLQLELFSDYFRAENSHAKYGMMVMVS